MNSPEKAPDRALMQEVLNAWATLNPASVAQFYASGQNIFFDVDARYESWEQYQQGAARLLANYQAATSTVSDDARIYAAGQYAWGTATVRFDMTRHSGQHDMGNMRWTVVWKEQNGKWLIVHEHGSMPLAVKPES